MNRLHLLKLGKVIIIQQPEQILCTQNQLVV